MLHTQVLRPRLSRIFAVLAIAIASARVVAGGNCPSDIAPGGGDGIVNVSDLLAVINSWGICPTPCPPHCPADVDHSCSVNVSDLLAVINGWGACPPCSADPAEPNNTCTQLFALSQVGSSQTVGWSSSRLSTAGDVDYFHIHAQETDSSCACCDFWCFDEDFKLTVTLTTPASAESPYQLCLGTSACALTNCVNAAPGSSVVATIIFDGQCPAVDDYEVYLRISAVNPGVDCDPYTLQYNFISGCF